MKAIKNILDSRPLLLKCLQMSITDFKKEAWGHVNKARDRIKYEDILLNILKILVFMLKFDLKIEVFSFTCGFENVMAEWQGSALKLHKNKMQRMHLHFKGGLMT